MNHTIDVAILTKFCHAVHCNPLWKNKLKGITSKSFSMHLSTQTSSWQRWRWLIDMGTLTECDLPTWVAFCSLPSHKSLDVRCWSTYNYSKCLLHYSHIASTSTNNSVGSRKLILPRYMSQWTMNYYEAWPRNQINSPWLPLPHPHALNTLIRGMTSGWNE